MQDPRSAHDTLAVGKAAKGGNPDLHMQALQADPVLATGSVGLPYGRKVGKRDRGVVEER